MPLPRRVGKAPSGQPGDASGAKAQDRIAEAKARAAAKKAGKEPAKKPGDASSSKAQERIAQAKARAAAKKKEKGG